MSDAVNSSPCTIAGRAPKAASTGATLPASLAAFIASAAARSEKTCVRNTPTSVTKKRTTFARQGVPRSAPSEGVAEGSGEALELGAELGIQSSDVGVHEERAARKLGVLLDADVQAELGELGAKERGVHR